MSKYTNRLLHVASRITELLMHSELRDRDLITDEDVTQIVSQKHTGFNVWRGDPFEDAEMGGIPAVPVARGVRRRMFLLQKRSPSPWQAQPAQSASSSANATAGKIKRI